MVVDYEVQGRVAIFTLNRPEARNAISHEVSSEMEAHLDTFEADPEVWVGILAGTGTVFSAGADLKSVAAKKLIETEKGGFAGLARYPRTKPLIAAVDGAALAGGLTIALSTTEGPAILPGGNPGLGIIMAVISACSASLYIIIGRKVRGEVSFVPYIWLVYAAGALVTLAIIAANGISLIGYDLRGYLWVLLLAILAQILGHGALNFVLRFMSPTTLTMTVQSAPILSAIWAYLIFSEIPTIPQAIGSVILVIGVTIVLRGQQVRRQPD